MGRYGDRGSNGSRRAKHTTGGANGFGIGRQPGPSGHILVNPIWVEADRAYRVGCQCNWETNGWPTEVDAIAAHDDHLRGGRPPQRPPLRRAAPPGPPPPPSLHGSIVQGSLESANPGWKLRRTVGSALDVEPTGVKPARVMGQCLSWQLIDKRDARWVIKPASKG